MILKRGHFTQHTIKTHSSLCSCIIEYLRDTIAIYEQFDCVCDYTLVYKSSKIPLCFLLIYKYCCSCHR